MTRPTGFSQQIADQILDRIADGEMLTKICQAEDMPTRSQFRHWLTVNTGLAAAYARARLAWADHWAERVMDISFNPQGAIDEQGNAVIDHATVALLRLQTDNAKWLVGKWAPRTYGDKPSDEPLREAPMIGRIERVIIDSPRSAQPRPEPPRQLEYKPEPPPANLALEDWALMREVMALIKRTIPVNDHRPPAEIFEVMRKALMSHFA